MKMKIRKQEFVDQETFEKSKINIKDEFRINDDSFVSKGGSKWYEEFKDSTGIDERDVLAFEEIQNLKKQASAIFTDAVILNKSRSPKSMSNSDYTWVKTVMSKGTKTDKIAAYTLLIQDSPLYNLNLLKNIVDMVKIGKKKECFMAVDTLCELFLSDLLPPNRKLLQFSSQPLSKLEELSSGNVVNKKRRLLLWYFEDQLKSIYAEFVNLLTKISYDTVEANKQKAISAMAKLLEGNAEMENLLLNTIVNKLGDPCHKVGSKVIYVLTKLLQVHPNMKEVIANAVEKVIFRNNISKRAQYYSICFLSQFCFFKSDTKIAEKLISIYISLFKACIKTGDIDSRMMSALLVGVKRAFPYLKEIMGTVKDHINTLYKIIHLSQPNTAIQALSLVHLISDHSNSHIDRFYSVLYKKIGEVEIFQSTRHAMLINLIYKAMKNDKEKIRVYAFIKRLFQICTYISVPVACGILIMISEILKQKSDILVQESIPEKPLELKLEEDSDDGEEYYKDVAEDYVSIATDPQKNSTDERLDETKRVIKTGTTKKIGENVKVWSNTSKCEADISPSQIRAYDPFVRNPLFAGAEKYLSYELFELAQHFHPTVALFANKIIQGEKINYSGDPFLDFTLIRFLDKFSFKNPKTIVPEEERNLTFAKFDRKKYYSSAPVRRLRANTIEYLRLNEKSIPVDETFLYAYMKEKAEKGYIPSKKDTSDTESVGSVGSDEFDELMNNLTEGKKDDINFLNEIGQLPKSNVKKKKGRDWKENKDVDLDDETEESIGEDEDDADLSDDGIMADDFDGDEVDDFSGDGEELEGSEIDEAELEASGIKLPNLESLKKNKSKLKKSNKKSFDNSIFASAEEFSELLEEAEYNAGDSEALSTKDRAGAKQLKWESDRDKWINKKNYKNKGKKRPFSVKNIPNDLKKIKKKKRF